MNLTIRDLKLLSKRLIRKYPSIIIGIASAFLAANMVFQLVAEYLIARSPTAAIYIINLLILLILTLFINILTVGFLRFFLLLARGRKCGYKDLLFGFQFCPDKIILLSIIKGLINYIWLLPSLVCLLLYRLSDYQTEPFAALFVLFLLIGLGFTCYFSITYSQALFFFAGNPSFTVKNALISSRKVMQGQKGKLFYLYASFLWLLVIGYLTCYLGFFIICPYFYLTLTFFHLDATQQITRDSLK